MNVKRFACGLEAGKTWYGNQKRFEVLPNAIDCQKYRYNENVRKEVRHKLGINEAFVIGHVGVVCERKNQKFLIEILSQIQAIKPHAILLLVGADQNSGLDDFAKKLGVSSKIIYMGQRLDDVNELLEAMDVFVFPSKNEGLPLAVVEAQAAGLPVIMSESITKEVICTENVIRISLDAPIRKWIEAIVRNKSNCHTDTYEEMQKTTWDIANTANRLVDYYAPKKKVLILLNALRFGGIEIAATSFQQHMDPDKFSFVYYLIRQNGNEDELIALVKDSGAKIIFRPEHVKGRAKEYFYLKDLIKEEHIDIVHDHLPFHGGISAFAAYQVGVKKRIAHSHFAGDTREISLLGKCYRVLMRKLLNKYATDKLACSEQAGIYLYGKNFSELGQVIVNGIDIEKFRFDAKAREMLRSELGITDELVIGHIGSIYWVKNQLFLIELLSEMIKKNNVCLLLCGEEQDNGACRRRAISLGIGSKVKFLGIRSDISKLLSAIDILVFPSKTEAFPVVPLEAQAGSLPCILSDVIVRDIACSDYVRFLSIKDSKELWINNILELVNSDRSKIMTESLKKKYDIQTLSNKLERIYEY